MTHTTEKRVALEAHLVELAVKMNSTDGVGNPVRQTVPWHECRATRRTATMWPTYWPRETKR